jgi:hypothetical protein
MMVVEEGLTRINMNHASEKSKRGLSVEVPDVMEKGKWMFESEVSS